MPLLLILLLAFFLRLNGLDFGLPYVFHDDEHQYVEAGLAFLESHEATVAELQKLNNPPLFKTVLGGLYLLYANLLPADSAAPRPALDSISWLTFFQYAGRFASAALGFLTVALLYSLGRRLYGSPAGLIAAFFLAVSFLHVRESHFAVNDAPLTFLVVLALYLAAGILRRGRWLDYGAAGLVAGLAAATKYTGVYLVAPLLAAHFLRPSVPKSTWRAVIFSPRLGVGLALVPLGFLLAAPIILTSWAEMFRQMSKLSDYGQFGYHDLLLAPHSGWVFYFDTLAWGAGFLMFGAIIAALVATLVTRYRPDLLLLIFALLLFLGMGAQQMVFVRFILPVLPPLILLLVAWLARAGRLDSIRTRPLLFKGAIAVLALQPLATSLWLGVILSRPDTRALAAAWLRANVPQGQVIYAEIHALPRYSVAGRVDFPYVQLEGLPFDQPAPLDYYQSRGATYIIASNYHHERKFTDPAKEAGRQQWVAALAQQQLLREFQPYWLPGRPFSFDLRYAPWRDILFRRLSGPVIQIYAVPPPPHWRGLDPFVESNQLLDRAAVFGYELASDPIPSGGEVEAAVFWLKQAWQEQETLFAALVDTQGFELVRSPAEISPEFSQEFQNGSRLLKSQARLSTPPGTPPGLYTLKVGVVDPQQRQEIASLDLPATITITTPARQPNAPGQTPPPGTSLAPGMTLLSAELVTPAGLQPDVLVENQDNWLLLLWRAETNLAEAYTIRLTLFDSQANPVAVWAGEPVYGTYPTARWQPGQLVRDPWNLSVPETIQDFDPNPKYELHLAVLDGRGQITGDQTLGTVQLSRRPRRAAPPPMQQTVKASWQEQIELLGFNIRAVPESADSGWLELDLFWQSIAQTGSPYIMGLRLVDDRGEVILAQEGPPQGGQAPVTGWQPGEVIQDFRSLRYDSLAMDAKYRLEIYLIDAQTGEIVPARQGDETRPAVLLTAWP